MDIYPSKPFSSRYVVFSSVEYPLSALNWKLDGNSSYISLKFDSNCSIDGISSKWSVGFCVMYDESIIPLYSSTMICAS